MTRDDVYPVRLTGKILLSDGSETEFSIQPDLGWQQWGNDREVLGATVNLLESLAQTAGDEGLRSADEDDEHGPGDYNDPGSKWNVEADMLGDD